MTVTYTHQVATCRGMGCFWKLLFRWKGSIYKLLWPNLLLFATCYSTLSFAYRNLMSQSQRDLFEKVSLQCQSHMDLIPVSFVLGFYVAIVVGRWWSQYQSIPWPDSLALYVSTLITGQDDRSRLIRRTILRYANLSILMTLTMICPAVKKRFPTMGHMIDSGFLLPAEQTVFESMNAKTSHPNFWIPLVWAATIVTQAKREGRIADEFSTKTLVHEINKIRSDCGNLLSYDWISIPLVYTQVTTLAVYAYFIASLMGNQYLDPSRGYPTHAIDLYFPVFTFLQFFFYMGWLMVAETLVNPFGDDDDDFDVNWLIDRNLQVSYVIVDELHQEYPKMKKDQYWNEIFPAELPYTEATKHLQTPPFFGSAQHIETGVEYLERRFFVATAGTGRINVRNIDLKSESFLEKSDDPKSKSRRQNEREDDSRNASKESLVSLTEYNVSGPPQNVASVSQCVSKYTPSSVVNVCETKQDFPNV